MVTKGERGQGGINQEFGVKRYTLLYIKQIGNSLAVQWLGLHALTAKGPGLISGRGTKIPQPARHGQKIKDKIKQINNKDLLYSTGNYIQYLLIIYNGKNLKKYINIRITESLCGTPETHHCKATILQQQHKIFWNQTVNSLKTELYTLNG